MLDYLLQFVAPHSCCGCGKTSTVLCSSCEYDIVSDGFMRCLVCLRPTSRDNLCSSCAISSSITSAWCVGLRDDVLKKLIDEFKFQHKHEASRLIVNLLDSRLPFLEVDAIVPIPTDPSHSRERGFAHMETIAKSLSKRRDVPYIKSLYRTRSGTQHHKNKTSRRAFAETSLSVNGSVKGKRILLVDDIYTTGATIHAATKLLLLAGAEEVSVAIVARQPLD